jgi:hypothetical protein
MLGLRKYGVKESDIEVLVRSGDEYVPFNGEALTNQDYVVQVKYDYDYNPLDITDFDKVDVNLNIFDRVVGQVQVGQGVNLTRLMKDATSLFDPTISNAALRAEDRSAAIEKQLVQKAKVFDEVYLNLNKTSQQKIQEYVVEANARGLKFDETYLHGRGYNRQEIKALREWKNYWDTVYLIENADMSRTLNAQGWQLWERGDTTLITRPIARNQLPKDKKFYDGETDTIRSYSDAELTEIYEAGGSVSELRTAIQVDGKEVTKMVVPQSSNSFSRRIRENDYILNYRHGYYSVKHQAPWFIDKQVLDDAGNVIRTETVASAGSIKEAKAFSERMSKTDGFKYIIREDRNSTRTIEDDYIDVNISQGRSAQRYRGKRLRDASGASDVDHNYIKDPVESMIDAARNVANRTSYSGYLEAAKRRFISNYKEVLPSKFGRYTYPSSIDEIKKGDVANTRMYQEARQTWEYLNYLQNAYINGIDEVFKSVIRMGAEVVGGKSSKAEKGLLWLADKNPSGFGKNLAFQAYLATNPLRQFVVQGHQAVQLAAIEPTFVATQLSKQTTGIIKYKMGFKNVGAKIFGVSREEMDSIVRAFDDSGLTANVDRHALIQGSLTQMADSWSYQSKAKRAAVKVASTPRKVGFDAGENINMITAWLTMRHRAIKSGKDMSRTDVQAEVGALARDFTYGMNFAGDMPYNQNSVAMIFQFMQAPHKAMLQMTSNKNLTKAEKAQMALFNGVMYSLPPTLMYSMFPFLSDIEDEQTRDVLVFGLESYLYNTLLTTITGEDTRLDFSGLSPADMYGFYDILTTLWTDGFGEAVANTPASSLLFGHNPRITDAFKKGARYFHLWEDKQERPEDFATVVEAALSVSSGYSNFMKASYALEAKKKLSSSGKLSNQVSSAEIAGTLFGFPTIEETQSYISNKASYTKRQEFRDDANKWYKELKRIAAKQGIANEDVEFEMKVHNNLLLHFREYPEEFNKIILENLDRDIRERDYVIYESATRNMGIMKSDEFKSWIQSVPMDESNRKELIQAMELLDKLRKEDN